MVRPLFMPCPPSWPSMARHQIEIQIDFSRFGSQRRHIQDIAAVPKKLNRTLVAIGPSQVTKSLCLNLKSSLELVGGRTGLIARPHMNRASFATVSDDPRHRPNFFKPSYGRAYRLSAFQASTARIRHRNCEQQY